MSVEKQIKNELEKVLTGYENMDGNVTEEDLYNMLLKIQGNWNEILNCAKRGEC